MKRIICLCIVACFLSSCGPFYYGYLPGTNYKILKPQGDVDLNGKTYTIEFRDNRGENNRINCSEYILNRETELEGDLGMQFFREAITSMIQNSNGKIDATSPNKITAELNGLSFRLIGAFYIVAHGFVQFDVASSSINKTYCSDMTDHDPDAPLKWYSLVTRKTATRLIVSGTMRRAVEHFVRDLASLPSSN